MAVNDQGKTYAGIEVGFADYNNDGWPDLVITDLANQQYAFYENVGDGTLRRSQHEWRPTAHLAQRDGYYESLDHLASHGSQE